MTQAKAHPELAEASNPTTPPRRLAELALHEEDRVRSAVAANPATPPSELRHLARKHWEGVANNPALPLLLVSEPGWFGHLDEPTLEAILGAPATPPAWWPLLAAHPASPLLAVEQGRVDILRALLEAGADPHATREIYADGNVHTVSALELAASRDLHEAVSLLLRTGKLAPHAPLDGLRAAMIRGQAPLVRTFLAEGVRFESPLVDAASRGPNSPFPVNQTPSLPGEILDALGAAALLGHHEAIRALLPLCGDLDRANRWSRTALWMAVRAGELPAVELLLAAGASPHVPSWHDTPLQEAARLGDPRILAALRGSSPGTRRL